MRISKRLTYKVWFRNRFDSYDGPQTISWTRKMKGADLAELIGKQLEDKAFAGIYEDKDIIYISLHDDTFNEASDIRIRYEMEGGIKRDDDWR